MKKAIILALALAFSLFLSPNNASGLVNVDQLNAAITQENQAAFTNLFGVEYGYTQRHFGWNEATPVPADYDGDGKTDMAVYHQAEGTWYIMASQDGFREEHFGWSEADPVVGDYDGDGITDMAVYHQAEGTWYIMGSQDGFKKIPFGSSEADPVPADYDGDGKTDIAVYYPGAGRWYIQGSRDGYKEVHFGWNEATPVPADYDGDGKTDIAVYGPSQTDPALATWYIWGSQDGYWEVQFGWMGADPVVGDYDGDGKADITIFYPDGGMWYTYGSMYRDALDGITHDFNLRNSSDVTNFINKMNKADQLDQSLQGEDATTKAAFAGIYGITVPGTASDNPDYVDTLFEVVTSAEYSTPANFISNIDRTYSFDQALSGHEDDFNTIYHVPPSQQVLGNGTYTTTLEGIFTSPGFSTATFISDLTDIAELEELFERYENTHNIRDTFAAQEGILVGGQNPATNPTYRSKLVEIVNRGGYDLEAYIVSLDGPAGLPVYEFDELERIIKATYTVGENAGDFITYEYYGTTTDKFEERFFASGWVWQQTIRYYTDGTTKYKEWFKDLDATPNGDTVYKRYDASGRIVSEVLDTGGYTLTSYGTGVKVENHFDDLPSWYQTTEYYDEAGTTLHYEWFKDLDTDPGGVDTVYKRYDASGRIVSEVLDTGGYILTSYATGVKVENYFDSVPSWYKTIEYWTDPLSDIKHKEWLKDLNAGLGDTIYRRYDIRERLVGETFDTLESINTFHWNTTDSEKQLEAYYAAGAGNFYKLIEYQADGITPNFQWDYALGAAEYQITLYWNGVDPEKKYEVLFTNPDQWIYQTNEYHADGLTLNHVWMGDLNKGVDGDVIDLDYDTQGRLIQETLDTGSYTVTQYWGATTYKKKENIYGQDPDNNLQTIYTYFDNGTNREESETLLENSIQTSYVRLDNAETYNTDEKIMEYGDFANQVYLNYMDDRMVLDIWLPSYMILDYDKSDGKGARSFLYSYHAGTQNKYFELCYSDQFWGYDGSDPSSSPLDGKLVWWYEYKTDGTILAQGNKSTFGGSIEGDSEVTQRLDLQNRFNSSDPALKKYDTTPPDGGFTFMPAMVGEPLDPFNQ